MAKFNLLEEERKQLLEEAEDFLTKILIYKKENQFDAIIELGEKGIAFCEKHQIWDYYVQLSLEVLHAYRIQSRKAPSILIESFKKLLFLSKTYFGENHILTAKVYLYFGIVYGATNRLNEGLDYFLKAQEIYAKSEGKNSLSLLVCYSYIGKCFKAIGNLLKAIDSHTNLINRGLELQVTNIFSGRDEQEKLYDLIISGKIDLGNDYYVLGDYDTALVYYKKAFKFQRQHLPNNNIILSNMYYSIANIYKQKTNYPLAVLYYNEGLLKCQEVFGESNQYLLKYFFGLGTCFGQMHDFQKKIAYYQKGLSLAETLLGTSHPDTIIAYSLLGNVYLENHVSTKALEYFEKCLKLAKKVFGENHPKISEPYCLTGQTYTQLLDFDNAKYFFDKSLKVRLKTLGSQHPQVSDSYLYLGIMHQKKGNYKEALIHLQNAICVFDTTLQGNDIYCLPTIKNYTPFRFFVTILKQKASAFYDYYFYITHQKQDYLAILHIYQTIDKLLSSKQKSFVSELSKLETSKLFSDIYGKYIQVLLSSPFEIENSFSIGFTLTEKVKAAVLHASLQENLAKNTSNIPSDLLQKVQEIKTKLTYFDKAIQREEAKGTAKDEERLEKLQSEFFDYHQSYTQLIQHFEQNYPNYYQLKYQTETVSVETIQANLSVNQWMVSYFVGETHYYIFFIGKGVFEVMEYEKPKSFEALVEDFLQSIQQHNLEEYEQKAYELYQLLLQPVEVYLIDMLADMDLMEEEGDSSDTPQLIVIPHDILNYVPFEALVCTRPGRRYGEEIRDAEKSKAYQEMDYLLLHCEVSYHYSATLWHYLQKQQESNNKITGERAPIQHDFVGFAPVYESDEEKASSETLQAAASSVRNWATRSEALRSDGTWTPLPYSKVETEQIAHLFTSKGLSSKTFLHEEATKEQFREAVEDSRFLLVAAHGVVNDERPKLSGLVFYPSSPQLLARHEAVAKVLTREVETLPNSESPQIDCILSMEETYHLNLQKTDLVVLSSCESGIGELAKGEGMMAVNRGFLYAGAKNVVSTLFKVYDKPSSLLTQYLFEAILEGKEYASALRAAKLKLMQQPNIDPKSWSGFVLIGG